MAAGPVDDDRCTWFATGVDACDAAAFRFLLGCVEGTGVDDATAGVEVPVDVDVEFCSLLAA